MATGADDYTDIEIIFGRSSKEDDGISANPVGVERGISADSVDIAFRSGVDRSSSRFSVKIEDIRLSDIIDRSARDVDRRRAIDER